MRNIGNLEIIPDEELKMGDKVVVNSMCPRIAHYITKLPGKKQHYPYIVTKSGDQKNWPDGTYWVGQEEAVYRLTNELEKEITRPDTREEELEYTDFCRQLF